MSTLAERLEHALKVRGMQPIDLDRALAARFGKKGSGTGYTHRVLQRGARPRVDHLQAIAEILKLADPWLIRGDGPMDRESATAVASYDSLPGWAEAAAVEIPRSRVAEYAIRAAGRSPAFVVPPEITPDFVFSAAMFWLAHAKDQDRQAAMRAEALRIKSIEDTRR